MWYLLTAEAALLVLLIKVVDWRAKEQRRRTELRVAEVRAVLARMERSR